MSILEVIMHAGPVGIFAILVMLIVSILGVVMASRGNSLVAASLLPVPVICAAMFYGYTIWIKVINFLHEPGVKDPNWYFYMTGEAGMFILVGGTLSLVLACVNIAMFGIRKNKKC